MPLLYEGCMIALATMHQKEQVIAPIFKRSLGAIVVVASPLDTDAFGTFTRDIQRPGSQIEAARIKAQKAIEMTGLELALASEGSFGPHPEIPYVAGNREVVLFLDLGRGLEIIGEHLSTDTNYSHTQVSSLAEAEVFAQKVGFPEHGLVVMPHSDSTEHIYKGITDPSALKSAITLAQTASTDGKVHLETDMRAMYNPTRMRVIAQATQTLVAKISSLCPQCATPGFSIKDVKLGLTCSLCGLPTNLPRSLIYSCLKCGFSQEQPAEQGFADPAHCPYCNP